jgi:predicted GNAT family N-acyltransferase
MLVERLSIDDIMSLRVRVLRQETPSTTANYPEDKLDDVVHFGIRLNGDVVATSTWFSKECPESPTIPAVQLKGMAVDTTLQTSGYGRALIATGIAFATDQGAHVVWARARDFALGFYEKCGFTVVGDGFIDEPTGMPHHIVMRDI